MEEESSVAIIMDSSYTPFEGQGNVFIFSYMGKVMLGSSPKMAIIVSNPKSMQLYYAGYKHAIRNLSNFSSQIHKYSTKLAS